MITFFAFNEFSTHSSIAFHTRLKIKYKLALETGTPGSTLMGQSEEVRSYSRYFALLATSFLAPVA